MSHCGTPALDYHLNHGCIVLKHVQHSGRLRNFYVQTHCQRETNQNCRAWLKFWFGFWCACLMWYEATNSPVQIDLWFYWIDFGNYKTKFQSSRAGIPPMH